MMWSLMVTSSTTLTVNKFNCPIQTFMAALFIKEKDGNFYDLKDMMTLMAQLKYIIKNTLYWMCRCLSVSKNEHFGQ